MIPATPVRPAAVSAKLAEAGNRKPETERLFHTAACVLLIAMLMAAPLAFGAVQPWAWGTMTGIVGCVLLLWALGCARLGTVEAIWSPLYIPALALLLMAVVQLRFGLTLDRVGTREAILKLVTYLAIFFLTQQLLAGQSERAWRMAAWAVALYAFVMALFAIIQFFAAPGLLYGVIKPRWGGDVFGPYVSRNNYAGLMEMLIPIAVAFAVSLRARHPAKPFLLFAIFTSLGAVFLSGSRGGAIALAVEFAILAVAIAWSGPDIQGRRRLLVTGLLLATAAGAFFSWLDPGDIWKRWEAMANTPVLALEDRDKLALDSLRMSREHLAHGVGVGAFEVAYPAYQTWVTDLVIDFAHNDYAQFFAEAGLLGWIVAPLSIAIFLVMSFRRLRSRLEQEPGWLQLGAAIGVCGIFVHSFSDFNLHIPANAAWCAFAIGLAVFPYRGSREGNAMPSRSQLRSDLV